MQRVYALCRRYLILTLFCLGTFSLTAQHEIRLRPVSDTYAIVNATIVPSPGGRIEGGTVVIKNGLIEAVGTNLSIPANAIIVQGDSLFVYAGFIDGLSYAGVNRPRDESKSKPEDPGNPPREQAGITPERQVVDYLNPDDQTLKDMRCAGFTAAHVVPHGNFMPGHGAVVMAGGKSPAEMVLRQDQSYYAKWTPNQGIYPSTSMGLMAVWRDMYHKAIGERAYTAVYSAGSAGLPRPVSSRDVQALYPVIDKKIPVFFKSEKLLDIHRALALQREFGFTMLLGNVKEGWDAADKIKASGAGVFLSLNFPEAQATTNNKKDGQAPDSTSWNEERRHLEKRKAEFIEKLVSQASAFQTQGIAFGFSTLGIKHNKVHDQLIRVIEAGLSEQAALAALTSNAAKLLNIANELGTLEKGKIANIVVSHRSYFDKKARVKFVFVDGVMHECEEPSPKKDPKKNVTLEGSWSFVAEVPQEKTDLKVVFTKENDQYKGNISGGRLPDQTELTNISLTDKKLRFSYSVVVEGTTYEVVVEGRLEGNGFDGSLNVAGFGTFPMTGVKDPKKQ